MKEITINWHITEQCNYSCNYCFAKYTPNSKKELHYSKKSIETVLKNIYTYFSKEFKNHIIRLNIAGGEPSLSKNLSFIIQTAYKLGFKVSIITNASKLTKKFIELNAKYLSIFAISVDSLNEITNTQIGRIFRDETLKTSTIIKNIEQFRILNNDIEIKINSVVNSYNFQEYLGDFIDLIEPDKWKIFQALSFGTENYCTEKEFEIFLENHKKIKTPVFKESNEDMTDSYIMIDPYGRFYQNTEGHYNYSNSIIDFPIEKAFSQIKFDLSKFKNRYIKTS